MDGSGRSAAVSAIGCSERDWLRKNAAWLILAVSAAFEASKRITRSYSTDPDSAQENAVEVAAARICGLISRYAAAKYGLYGYAEIA